MAGIEQRTEVWSGQYEPDYAARGFTDKELRAERHRTFVGGRWDEMGRRQLEFLRRHGLEPDMRFLDVGCGALRAGRFLVDHLQPGHYYGIDVNHQVLQVGYDTELDDGQRSRLPVGNLRATDRFDADFGVTFDLAIAQSLFSHLSLNQIRLCLVRTAAVLRPGGKLYATFFERPSDAPVDEILPGGKHGRYTERNPYSYYRDDLAWAADPAQWSFRYVGTWGHPAGQRMVEYTRLDEHARGHALRTRARRAAGRGRRTARRLLR
ncbi:MAG TPA: class I SAM-dependent methyltransferase [Segeticoccus sp.]|nr:class I SAM-dependent methyltransferase [Segeticoccus sp.]